MNPDTYARIATLLLGAALGAQEERLKDEG